MKKPPPYKAKRPTRPIPKTAVDRGRNGPTLRSKETPVTSGEKTDTKLTFGPAWKGFWSYAGPLFTLLGLWVYWTPNVAITSGVNLDPLQQLQTQFVVTNIGHVSVYHLAFTCTVIGDNLQIGELKSTYGSLQPMAALRPGDAASRGCFTKSFDVSGTALKVEAHFIWPLINRPDMAIAYFSVRKGASGTFLVPDAPAGPESPSLLTIHTR